MKLPDTTKGIVILGLKVLALLVVIAAPALIASNFVVGVFGVAFYGVLSATFAWITGGARIGAAVVVSLAVLGVASIMLREQTWALALILCGLGVLYGYASSRGVGKAVLQLPILTPYFMMAPPSLFTDPPKIGPPYVLGIVVVMVAAGMWAILVLHFATGTRKLKVQEIPDARVPLWYGTVLGVISAVVMLIGTGTPFKSHWAWVILTLYVLADPTQLLTTKKMLGRVLGTLAGFAIVTALAMTPIPDGILQVLALPAVWLCVLFLIFKKPYWQYSMFLTVSVVLMNSHGVNTLLLNAERIGFTILGALLSILVAFLISVLHFHRVGVSAPTLHAGTAD